MELSNNMKSCDFFLAAILLDFFPYLATQLTRSSEENLFSILAALASL